MTKADLIEAVSKQALCSRKEAALWVEDIFDLIKEALGRGQSVRISGFGNFEIRIKRPRRGRNPQTGEVIEISGRQVLTFHPSQILKGKLRS